MVYFCFLSCLLFFSLMQFPLLFAAFWSQNCCILELTSPICMPTWLLAFGFGFTWLLAFIGFLFPTFLCGVLVFFGALPSAASRLLPPASLHTQLCHTQLFVSHNSFTDTQLWHLVIQRDFIVIYIRHWHNTFVWQVWHILWHPFFGGFFFGGSGGSARNL